MGGGRTMGKLFQCHKTRLASPMTRDMHFHVSAMHIFKHYTPGLPTVLTGARITLLFAFIYCYVEKHTIIVQFWTKLQRFFLGLGAGNSFGLVILNHKFPFGWRNIRSSWGLPSWSLRTWWFRRCEEFHFLIGGLPWAQIWNQISVIDFFFLCHGSCINRLILWWLRLFHISFDGKSCGWVAPGKHIRPNDMSYRKFWISGHIFDQKAIIKNWFPSYIAEMYFSTLSGNFPERQQINPSFCSLTKFISVSDSFLTLKTER